MNAKAGFTIKSCEGSRGRGIKIFRAWKCDMDSNFPRTTVVRYFKKSKLRGNSFGCRYELVLQTSAPVTVCTDQSVSVPTAANATWSSCGWSCILSTQFISLFPYYHTHINSCAFTINLTRREGEAPLLFSVFDDFLSEKLGKRVWIWEGDALEWLL